MSRHPIGQKFLSAIARENDNFILVIFYMETMSPKQMALPKNQFSCKQIQGVKYIKIHRNKFI